MNATQKMLICEGDESGWQWQIRENFIDQTSMFNFISLPENSVVTTGLQIAPVDKEQYCTHQRVSALPLNRTFPWACLSTHIGSTCKEVGRAVHVPGNGMENVGEGHTAWLAGLGHQQPEQLHPIQSLVGDRYDTDDWLAKVKMTYSRKPARVGCMQLDLIHISFKQKCFLLFPLLPALFSFLCKNWSEKMAEFWAGSCQVGWLSASHPVWWHVLWVLNEDNLAALWTQSCPVDGSLGEFRKVPFLGLRWAVPGFHFGPSAFRCVPLCTGYILSYHSSLESSSFVPFEKFLLQCYDWEVLSSWLEQFLNARSGHAQSCSDVHRPTTRG